MPDSALTIRRARPSDAADMARQMAQPGVCGWLTPLPLPLPNKEMWRQRLEQMFAPDKSALLFAAELRGQAMACLHPRPPQMGWS